jgi:preprotein translocase subunit SecF
MQLFSPGKLYDFMSQRRLFMGVSFLMVIASIVLLFRPGPNLGTDFVGGTEIEVAFRKSTSAEQLRTAIQAGGFSRPDVIRVEDPTNPDRWLIRVQEVSIIDEEQQATISRRLCVDQQAATPECPPERTATEVKFSPGGDKILVRFQESPDLGWIRERLTGIDGVRLRGGANNPVLQNARDNRVEIQLMSRGDQLMDALRQGLGAEAVPENPLRSEWIGPKAGAQLRDAALKSIAIALVFIMAYIALRFDLRFAPGAAIALIHDALVTVGILTLLQRELNLTTVAAVLFIIGYSVNDTVVVFDRVRENLGKLRGASFMKLVNVSLSEMLNRTVLTSGTTVFSLVCFFIWGTGALKDFAFTLILGLALGTYSSIYVALPITAWFDRTIFKQRPGRKPLAQKAGSERTAAA